MTKADVDRLLSEIETRRGESHENGQQRRREQPTFFSRPRAGRNRKRALVILPAEVMTVVDVGGHGSTFPLLKPIMTGESRGSQLLAAWFLKSPCLTMRKPLPGGEKYFLQISSKPGFPDRAAEMSMVYFYQANKCRELMKPEKPMKKAKREKNVVAPKKPASAATQPDLASPSHRKEESRWIDADQAKLLAVEFCLFHYPTLYTGGVPRTSPALGILEWIVPIVLASPSYGVMGQVGELRIDGRTGKVVSSTDRAVVIAGGEKLYQGKTDGTPSLSSRKR